MTTKNTTTDEKKNWNMTIKVYLSLSESQNEFQIFEYIPNQPMNPYTDKA